MISTDHINNLQGATVVGANGERIGDVGQVLVDTATGQPEWVSVRTGMFGTHETLVPISEASLQSDQLSVPFTKDQIKSAPRIAPDQDLSQDDESRLYQHYGLDYSTASSSSGLPSSGGTSGFAAGTASTGTSSFDDTSLDREASYGDESYGDRATGDTYIAGTGTTGYGDTGTTGSGTRGYGDTGTRDTGYGDDAMTRSEEQVRVGTERVNTGTARLRKYVDTEEVNVPVTVQKEKVRLETEPITDANRGDALSGPDISEGEHEVTLSEERPVVQKEAVPVERVRLAKDVETEEQTVNESVRKERIDSEGVNVYPEETNTTQSERNLR